MGPIARSCRAAGFAATLGMLVACSSGDGKAKAGAVVSTTPVQTTTTAVAAQLPGPASTAVPPTNPLSSGPPYQRTNGPSGSGCTPPKAPGLPDGWWAGRLRNIAGTSFDFDVVCWFAGQAAIKAGGEDDEGPVEDDYYVRNTDDHLFRENIPDPNAPATCVGDDAQPFACTAGDVLSFYASGSISGTISARPVTAFSTVWLHVSAGEPDYLYMQFTP